MSKHTNTLRHATIITEVDNTVLEATRAGHNWARSVNLRSPFRDEHCEFHHLIPLTLPFTNPYVVLKRCTLQSFH